MAMFSYTTNTETDNIRQWVRSIHAFAEACNFKPTWQQNQLFDAVQRGCPRIAIKSGMGPGKSAATALVALWRTFRAKDALTVVTAPSMRQCMEVFMSEVRRHIARAHPLIGQITTITKTRVEFRGNKDWCIRSATATKKENIFGNHNEHMTVICEEASGISRDITDALKGTMSNPDSLVIMIGNPSTRDSAFFDCFHNDRANWERLTWNAEETPESKWFTKLRNKQVEDEYGRDSNVYRISVLGEFPHIDPDCIISEEMLKHAFNKKNILLSGTMPPVGWTLSTEDKGAPVPIVRQFGIDLARKGGDESVIFRRQGMAIAQWHAQANKEPSDVIKQAFAWQKAAGWQDKDTRYVFDAGGMGQGVVSVFADAGKRYYPFQFGGRSSNTRKYANQATEAWFNFAKILKNPDKYPLYIPEDRRLIEQLTSRRYEVHPKSGALIIESKEIYNKTHDSPDRADALVMAFFDRGGVSRGRVSDMVQSGGKVGMGVQL